MALSVWFSLYLSKTFASAFFSVYRKEQKIEWLKRHAKKKTAAAASTEWSLWLWFSNVTTNAIQTCRFSLVASFSIFVCSFICQCTIKTLTLKNSKSDNEKKLSHDNGSKKKKLNLKLKMRRKIHATNKQTKMVKPKRKTQFHIGKWENEK